MRKYSELQLIEAVAAARSWRGVLKALGLSATSASAIRSVRQHADRLSLDYTHFRGSRQWTDAQLALAVDAATSWAQVASLLGLQGGSGVPTIRGHAARLGIPTAHLASEKTAPATGTRPAPTVDNLRRAGSLLAAAWFELCGRQVSWPLEPCRYDLLVWHESRADRVQVKTTTTRKHSSWSVSLTTGGSRPSPYDPDDIDQFFVVDGDLAYYLIPVAAVGGLHAIQLSAYQAYRLPGLATATVESAGARPD